MTFDPTSVSAVLDIIKEVEDLNKKAKETYKQAELRSHFMQESVHALIQEGKIVLDKMMIVGDRAVIIRQSGTKERPHYTIFDNELAQ